MIPSNTIPQELITQCKNQPIMAVAELLGLQINPHTRKALCPMHDDHHPSLSFDLKRNTCRCFSCMTESMDTIALVMGTLHVGFKEACRWLAEGQGIMLSRWKRPTATEPRQEKPFDAKRYERFFHRPTLTDEARHFLFDQRRLHERVVSWCRLNSWTDHHGTPWLDIPYYSAEGQLIGLQRRNLRPGSGPRFRFLQGEHCSIYNLPVTALLSAEEALYIAEGPSDCWALLSAGHKAVAFPSATTHPHGAVETLRRLQEQKGITLHIYPDRDKAGEDFYEYLSHKLPSIVRHTLPEGCKDFAEAYVKQRKEVNHE